MTLVVLGLDALDPELVNPSEYPHLTLDDYASIDTIVSSSGEPSTHELWPTIITGLRPTEHGIILNDGVAWENPVLRHGSGFADYVLPDSLQTRLGAWLLNNTGADAFRTPATYYEDRGIDTVFDDHEAKPIGIPNYVVDPDDQDREHQLRRKMGGLFERDPDAEGGHTSDDPFHFYELCLEMSMVRIARVRRALRDRRFELVFGYTSGLDLVGHVSYDNPELQAQAYGELNEFVGELRGDLESDDELLIVSDHGLQDGVHTKVAMVAATMPDLVESIDGVVDVRTAIEDELRWSDHQLMNDWRGPDEEQNGDTRKQVKEQLQELGYI